MAEFISLRGAIEKYVDNGSTVAMEGFTHLIPFAAGHEIIRQKKVDLTLIRMTPDLIYDQMIGAGCASKLIFSWGGNPGVGSLHRFRDAVQNGFPTALQIEEHGHADMASRYQAGASGLPLAVLRGYIGSDLKKYNKNIKNIICPFSGEQLIATPAINPQVTIIHAQKADKKGNVLIQGIIGVQKEAVLAAKNSIVTVEEIVDHLDAPMNSCVLPHWVLSAICHEPGGAHPSYAHGYYERDNAFCRAWDEISRDKDMFYDWITKYIYDTPDFAAFKKLLAQNKK